MLARKKIRGLVPARPWSAAPPPGRCRHTPAACPARSRSRAIPPYSSPAPSAGAERDRPEALIPDDRQGWAAHRDRRPCSRRARFGAGKALVRGLPRAIPARGDRGVESRTRRLAGSSSSTPRSSRLASAYRVRIFSAHGQGRRVERPWTHPRPVTRSGGGGDADAGRAARALQRHRLKVSYALRPSPSPAVDSLARGGPARGDKKNKGDPGLPARRHQAAPDVAVMVASTTAGPWNLGGTAPRSCAFEPMTRKAILGGRLQAANLKPWTEAGGHRGPHTS
jgi:hypothetical protein